MEKVNLTGTTALVTGATSGLGVRFARVLAEHGARVAIAGRRVERLQTLESELKKAGTPSHALSLDVTDVAAFPAALDGVERALGPVDILVNNAGMNVEGRVTDVTPDAYDQIMGTNVRGPFFLAAEVARRMQARKAEGRIINIASIGAFKALPGLVTYCMSKAAIAMMTKGLAREWARHGINVNAICPGYIETEINADWFATESGKKQIATFPRRRLGNPEDLDGMLLLLASDASRLITGTMMTVDDGQSL